MDTPLDGFTPIGELAPRVGEHITMAGDVVTVEIDLQAARHNLRGMLFAEYDHRNYLRTLAHANGGRPPLRRIK